MLIEIHVAFKKHNIKPNRALPKLVEEIKDFVNKTLFPGHFILGAK